jgi:AbrB family looped-hinge helix DNA binding protein
MYVVKRSIGISSMSESVRLSSKYQVVIPKGIRERLNLEKGDELTVGLQGENIVMRVRPESFAGYTLGLHGDIWKDVEPTEYVEGERSRWERRRRG